jgi:RNA polymerase sigma factor (sigma-70 family)
MREGYNEQVERLIPLVTHIAKDRSQWLPTIDADDLFQAAMLEIVRATDRHDPELGDFDKFGSIRARGAMSDYLHRDLSERGLAGNSHKYREEPISVPLPEDAIDRYFYHTDRYGLPTVSQILTVLRRELDKRSAYILARIVIDGVSVKDMAEEANLSLGHTFALLRQARITLRKAPEFSFIDGSE